MTWTKLGDEFPAAARDLTDAEFRTHVEALCWSSLRLLDQRIPKDDVRRFAESADASSATTGLAVKGWWADCDGYWEIGVKFREWQEERRQVEHRRAANAEVQRRGRAHRIGDHSLCIPAKCSHAPPRMSGGESARVSADDKPSDSGRVGSGPTDPPDPKSKAQSQDQSRRLVGDPIADKERLSNTGTSQPEQPLVNSQNRRVHQGPGTVADDAQQIPNHNSESATTDRYARASDADKLDAFEAHRQQQLDLFAEWRRNHPEPDAS